MSADRGFVAVVPARYASTRLPGKPLSDIAGRPMVVRVVDRVLDSGAREVVVATDDERIADAVRAAGAEAELTAVDHPTGSDRVMEVVARRGWPDDAIVVNVQGDEPLIPPSVVDQVAGMLHDNPEFGVATLCHEITDRAEFDDPNAVKVVRDSAGAALYFSRAPIPFPRSAAFSGALRHVGVYAYRVHALRRFVELPSAELEVVESLEQLRLLANGVRILVATAEERVPGGVDTPEDLARVVSQFESSGGAPPSG